MLNKKLVLGSLAGATLLVGAAFMLPTVAEATVTGTCATCHTMHATGEVTEGVDNASQFGYLLVGGCWGCHTSGALNGANGRAGGGATAAPQVDNPLAANMTAGGYFDTANPGNMHSVDETTLAPNMLIAPGSAGAFTLVDDATESNFNCTDCHGEKGHHGTVTSYRSLLANHDNVDATAGINQVTPGTAAITNFGVDGATNYAVNQYDDVSANLFCSSCHPNFHGAAGTGTGSPWIRHPTNVTTVGYGNAWTGDAAIPVGNNASGPVNAVMCLSCHYAHGGPYADLLTFDKASGTAGVDEGGAGVWTGCEVCHDEK